MFLVFAQRRFSIFCVTMLTSEKFQAPHNRKKCLHSFLHLTFTALRRIDFICISLSCQGSLDSAFCGHCHSLVSVFHQYVSGCVSPNSDTKETVGLRRRASRNTSEQKRWRSSTAFAVLGLAVMELWNLLRAQWKEKIGVSQDIIKIRTLQVVGFCMLLTLVCRSHVEGRYFNYK